MVRIQPRKEDIQKIKIKWVFPNMLFLKIRVDVEEKTRKKIEFK